jgi:hypothetical protein
MSRSSIALYNLRGFVILIVVAFHSFLAYLGSQPATRPRFDSLPYQWKAVPIIDAERWYGFDLFCASQYLYVMQFMFLLSGLFVWPSLQRKGVRTFIRERGLRLGVPFVLGVYLLMPLAHYPVYRVDAVDPGWSAFWSHWIALPFWPTGPMWFLWCLLAFDLIAAALYRFAPTVGERLGRLSAQADATPGCYFIALLAASALAYIPMAVMFKPWDWIQVGPFAFQPSFLPLYLVYFFAGLGIGAHGVEQGLLAPSGMLAGRWRIWLAGAFAGFVLWIVPSTLMFERIADPFWALDLIADLGFVLASVSACFALAAVFLRFAVTRSPVFDSLSANAYGIYIIHYVLVIWLQYLLLGTALPAVAKGATVFTITLLASWALIDAMCRLPIGARLMRAERRS